MVDSSGGGNDGTINGGAVYVPGVVGAGALSFDGTDDYVDVGLVPALDLTGGSYTIAFWAKQDAAQLGRIVNMDDGNATPLAGYSVFASGPPGANMRVTHSNGDANDFNVPSPIGVWFHTAVTYDSGAQTLTLWIDGVDLGSIPVPGGNLTTEGDDPLYFGALRLAGGSVIQHFDGLVDDIRLYDVALSGGEINDLILLASAEGPLDTWTAEGYDFAGSPYVGDWRVSADGTRVSQVSEASAAVFFGDADAVGSHRVSMRGLGDNDFIGFVLGYQAGDVTNTSTDGTYSDGASYLQLDWRRGNQTNNNFSDSCVPGSGTPPEQQEGLTLSHIRGTPTLDELLGRVELADCPGEFGTVDVLATGNTLGAVGWQSNQFYDFEFEFDGTRLKVWVDGTLEFDLDVPGPITGHFGFMARSQAVEFVIHREILPVSYDMPGGDGTDQGGTYDYLDDTYPQSSEAVPLSGGLGDLSDGFIASENFNVNLPGIPQSPSFVPPASYEPYVGWWIQSPTITFSFADPVDIGSVRVWVDDTNGDGQVRTPAAIDVAMGGVSRSFTVIDPPGDAPFPVDLPVGGLPTSSSVDVTISPQLVGGTGWVFVSEVEFFAPQSIQALVNAASPGDIITLESLPLFPAPPGSDPEIYNETVYIDKDLTIEGSGVTIDGSGLGDDVVDGVPVITTDAATVTLRDLTVTGGSASDGGGINQSEGTLTLDGVHLMGNTASSLGGGLYSYFGDVVIQDSATRSSLIDGNSAVQGAGVLVDSGSLTATNATISSNTATGSGGGVNAANSCGGCEVTVSITSSTISGNAAAIGGGLRIQSSTDLSLVDSSITGNTASGGGAGLYFTGSSGSVDGSQFSSNVASGASSTGGAIYTGTDLVIEGSAIGPGNIAFEGGGVSVSPTGSLEASNSVFSGNRASGSGGGIHSESTMSLDTVSVTGNEAAGQAGGIFSNGAATFVDSDISGNRSGVTPALTPSGSNGDGGGILSDAALRMRRSTVSGNTATGGSGGGLYGGGFVENSTFSGNTAIAGTGGFGRGGGVHHTFDQLLTLSSVTITDNTAARGGGFDSGSSSFGAEAFNTIIAGNSAPSSPDCFDLAGATTNFYNSFVDDTTDCLGYTLGPPFSENNLPTGSDVMLDVLADNGGPTETHALLPGSDAIDAGSVGDTVTFNGFGGALPAPLTFNDRPGTTNGASIVDEGGQHVLRTHDPAFTSGSAFLNQQLPLHRSFSSSFEFQIEPLNLNGGQPGDGFTFIVTDSPTFLGDSAGRLGIGAGVGNSSNQELVAVDFDIYFANRVGINVGADMAGDQTLPDVSRFISEVFPGQLLADNASWFAWIDYQADTGLFEVRLARSNFRPVDAFLSYTVNVADQVGARYGYFGFTGGSGVATANFDIVNWELTTGLCPGLDQRGIARPQGAGCDIGAYEAVVVDEDLLDFSFGVAETDDALTPGTVPVGVAVVPITDIPYEAIAGGSGAEYASAPLASIPLASIPLASIDIDASPLASIPLASIPLASIPLASIPVESLPLASIPLASIPLASIGGWEAILDDTAEYAGELPQNVTLRQLLELVPPPAGLENITLRDVAIADSPLASISLPSLALGGVPLTEIDPTLCDGIVADCSVSLLENEILGNDVDTLTSRIGAAPLASIALTEAPLASIPLASIPLASITLDSLPLASIDLLGAPLASIPLASIPLASIPLASIDIVGSPLASIPLASIEVPGFDSVCDFLVGSPAPCSALVTDASSLGEYLSSIGGDIESSPLASIPLASIDLGTIPLASIPLASIPLASIDTSDLATAPLGYVPLASIGAGGACAELSGTAYDCGTLGLTDANTLLDLVAALAGTSATLSDTALETTPLASIDIAGLPLASIDLDVAELNGAPLASIPLASIGFGPDGLAATPLASIPLASIPLASINDVVDCGSVDCTATSTDNLGDAALAGALQADASLGDLGSAIPATFTLGELGDLLTIEILYGAGVTGFDLGDVTIGQILIALLLNSDFPWETLPLADLGLQEVAPNSFVTYSAGFELTGDEPVSGEIVFTLPDGFLYATDTTTISDGATTTDLADATFDGGSGDYTLGFTADAPGTYTVEWQAVPGFDIGLFTGSAEVSFVEIPAPSAPVTSGEASITVVEEFQGNIDIATASLIPDNALVFSHIATPNVADYFEFTAGEVGTRHAVFLSQFDADTDLVLYQPATEAVSDVDARAIPLASIPIEDDGINYGSNATEEPELEADIPTIAAAPLASISINRGEEAEAAASTLAATPLGADPTYTIQVSGYQGNSSTSPYVVRVKKEQVVEVPFCTPVTLFGTDHTPPAGTLPLWDLNAPVGDPGTPLPDGLNTIFLLNYDRLVDYAGQYPAGPDADALIASINALIADGANGVVGAIIAVENYGAVATQYAEWDADPCDPLEANDVVAEITSLVDTIQQSRPSLSYVTIVGADDLVPFARIPDLTAIANESTYTEPFSDGALYGALATRHYLSDDPYGDLDPIPWLERYLHVPDLGVGRLVEDPVDIVQALDNFVTFNGLLDPQTAAVAGYDFLEDGSTVVSDRLANIYGASNVANLIDTVQFADASPLATWTREDLLALLDFDDGTPDLTADIFSVNAHSDHYRQLPSFGDANDSEDNLYEVGDAVDLVNEALGLPYNSLAGDIIFTMGCHAGLSVSDVGVSAAQDDDWAQAYSRLGAAYFANSGYGYGDTAGVALSERLMAEFAENLNGTLDIGLAMTFAKQEYFAQLGQYSVYDEKAMQQVIFYGLPMYAVGATPPEDPPEPLPVATDPSTGLEAASITVAPTYELVETAQGDYYAIDGQTQDTHYRPKQPRDGFDVTQDGLLAHGAIVTSATTTDVPGFDPVYFRPNLTGSATVEPEVDTDEIATAAFGLNLATYNRPANAPGAPPFEQAQLVSFIGGSFLSPADGLSSGVQRNTQTAEIRVLYADPSDTDFEAPAILSVDSVLLSGSQVSFTVTTDALDVADVLVLYRNEVVGGISNWVSTSLVEGAPGVFTGGGPVDGSGVIGGVVDFKVWVIDDSGNVSTTDFKNVYWQASAPPPPTNPGGFSTSVTPPGLPDPNPNDELYPGPVTINVDSIDPSVQYYYSIGNGPLTPLGGATPVPGDGSFVVDADGVNYVHIEAEGGDPSTDLIIAIDSTGPSDPVVTSPYDGEVLLQNSSATYQFSCPDAGTGSESCEGLVNGTTSVFSDGTSIDTATLGSNSLSVTAIDVFGRTNSVDTEFQVVAPLVVSGPAAPAELGSPSPVSVDLIDVAGYTETVSWYWDDGTTTLEQTSSNGFASAQHTYAETGVYRVRVEVDYVRDSDDVHGGTLVAFFEFVVIYDPSDGFVTGGGWFHSPEGAYALDPTAVGRANFGFNSKYKKGANRPTGKTTFKFKAGDLNFKSDEYDWLVISGARARYKGIGTVKGISGEWQFMITALDADINDNDSHDADAFRIKIWREETIDGVATEFVLYDNGFGVDESQGDGGTTELGGGSIVIHTGKKK